MPTAVVYAEPSLVIRPPVDPWPGIAQTWTGWDGTVWAMNDPASGVRFKPGIRGLGKPDFDQYTSTSPAVAGSRHRGSRAKARDVFWPLMVFEPNGSQAWIEYDRAFWRTLSCERTGIWTVTQPNGESRTLRCRFDNDGGAKSSMDPSRIGWAPYEVYLVADDPFWEGPVIPRSWSAAEPVDFYSTDSSRLYYVSDASLTAGATITNPGDEPTWPLWIGTGPITSLTATIGGSTLTLPGTTGTPAVASGNVVIIDTAPTAQTAYVGPASALVGEDPWNLSAAALAALTDVTGSLTAAGFAPVPAGDDVALTLTLVGAGSVSVQIRPLYHRAW